MKSIQLASIHMNGTQILQGKPVAGYFDSPEHICLVTLPDIMKNETWRIRTVSAFASVNDDEEFLFVCINHQFMPPVPVFVLGQRIR